MRFFRRFISHFFWALLSLMITLVIVFGAVYTYVELQLPDVSVLNDMHMQVPLRVYSRDGKLIAEYGAKRRIPVTLDKVPKHLIQAVLATEDARFYSHPGVDFISLVRAAKAVVTSGRKVQGASTITMQVARNFFLSKKKTYKRKIKEILLALKIDKEFSKDKILELYLNKVYFGKRAYGVAAAAKVYYGKDLSQLTLPEMAMLAGLPQAPSRNNPINRPQRALARRNHVLSRMYEVGFIDKKTYQKAVKAPLTAKYHGAELQVRAPYIAEMVRQVLVRDFGKTAYDMGLTVYTTILSKDQNDANRALQRGLIAYSARHGFHQPTENLGWPSDDKRAAWEKALRKLGKVGPLQAAAVTTVAYRNIEALLANGKTITIAWSGLAWARPALRGGYKGAAPRRASDIVKPGDVIWVRHKKDGTWTLSQIPKVQGALVSLNPQTGAIIALDGGFSFRLSNFNRVVQAERQPGSNFKPFIYSAALAKGYTLASLINDAPVVVSDTGENSLWRPRNDTLKFYGPTRLRIGLIKSRNLVSIRLLQAVGVDYALDYIKRFGFNPNKLPHTLSLALGSGVVTPLKIAVGYSVFANGGYRVKPYFIQKVIDENGKVIYQANPAKACDACTAAEDAVTAPQALTPQNAYLITQALRDVIKHGTGRAARVLKRPDLAGKTGTTNDQVDAWFSGFNSNIETTVWVGFDDLKSIHEYGSQAALPIWIHFMRGALANTPEATMPQPPDIVAVRIDPHTGMLAQPDQKNGIFELFRKQNEPTQETNTRPSHLYSGGTSGDAAAGSASEPLF